MIRVTTLDTKLQVYEAEWRDWKMFYNVVQKKLFKDKEALSSKELLKLQEFNHKLEEQKSIVGQDLEEDLEEDFISMLQILNEAKEEVNQLHEENIKEKIMKTLNKVQEQVNQLYEKNNENQIRIKNEEEARQKKEKESDFTEEFKKNFKNSLKGSKNLFG